MGRHASHRTAVPWIGAVAIAAVVLAVTVVALRWDRGGASTSVAASSCGRSLRVVTASTFAPVLAELAPSLGRGDDCLRIETSVVDGRAAGGRLAPLDADVWIPDDLSWAATAPRDVLAGEGEVGSGAVLATSPIYMVTDKPTAARLQKAGGSWLALAGLLEPSSGVRLAVRDPGRSGDGMVGAGAVAESVWQAKGMDASALMLARAKPVTRTVTTAGAAMPSRSGEVGLVPEHALLGLGTRVPAGLTVLPGTDFTAQLRFSWLPTAVATGNVERAAGLRRLLGAITGPDGKEALAAAQLRGPGATAAPGAANPRLPRTTAKDLEMLGEHHVDHIFAAWYPEDRRADLLVAVDVSGSMRQPAPGTSTPLITLVRQGARALSAELPDSSRLGLWEFGVHLNGTRDHRSLVPVRALTPGHRAAFARAAGSLEPKDTGTGLHDTILAAYLSAQATSRRNIPAHVLVFTDGRDEDDAGSITMAQLSAALTKAQNPEKPVYLTVIAFGSRPEGPALQKAIGPVFGYVQNTNRAADVPAAFVHSAAGGLHH